MCTGSSPRCSRRSLAVDASSCPAKFSALSFLAHRTPGLRRHLVFRRADHPSAALLRAPAAKGGPPAPSRCVFIRSCSAHRRRGGKHASRSGRSLRRTRCSKPMALTGGRTSDIPQPTAPASRKAGSGRPRDGHRDQHHGRCRRHPAAQGERAGEVVIPGRSIVHGYGRQPRGECHVVRGRVVSDRRSRNPRRRGLSHARRPHQGADQPRRREDLAS